MTDNGLKKILHPHPATLSIVLFTSSLFLGTLQNILLTTKPLHVCIQSLVPVSTAAQSNTCVCIATALLLSQHVCVKGPGHADATGL